MVRYKLYSALVLIVFILVIVFQNTEMVETKCLFMTVSMPRAALLSITMLVGIAVGVLLSLALSKRFARKR